MARLIGVPSQVGTGGFVRGTVKVLGVPEALIKLGLVNKVARIELGVVASKTAKNMYDRARFYCPVITGNLRDSIKVTHVGPYAHEVSASSREGPVGEKNSKEYAGFVEFGTSKMGPRAFMRRAYSESQAEAAVALVIVGRHLEAL